MHRLLLAVAVLLAVQLLGVIGCGGKPIDVVDGIEPVSRALAHVGPTLTELAELPPAQQATRLREVYPHLEQDVVYYLRKLNKLSSAQTVERVEFLFGSSDHAKAEDATGTIREGIFRNQLLAKVYVRREKPIVVIVQCLNGTFMLPEDLNKLQYLGSYIPEERFTIQRGEGLIHHVDFRTAIDIAERFNLPLYRGRQIEERYRIDFGTARHMEPNTDQVQVTVYVVEGDTFDLREMVFHPSPKRTR